MESNMMTFEKRQKDLFLIFISTFPEKSGQAVAKKNKSRECANEELLIMTTPYYSSLISALAAQNKNYE